MVGTGYVAYWLALRYSARSPIVGLILPEPREVGVKPGPILDIFPPIGVDRVLLSASFHKGLHQLLHDGGLVFRQETNQSLEIFVCPVCVPAARASIRRAGGRHASRVGLA
jgi:hypothetical protein